MKVGSNDNVSIVSKAEKQLLLEQRSSSETVELKLMSNAILRVMYDLGEVIVD